MLDVRLRVGRVQDVLPHAANLPPGGLCLLHVDVDFSDATLAVLRALWPKLQPGGVLVMDDYGYWRGARAAWEAFAAEAGLPSHVHRCGVSQAWVHVPG